MIAVPDTLPCSPAVVPGTGHVERAIGERDLEPPGERPYGAVYADRARVETETDSALRLDADGKFYIFLATELLVKTADCEEMFAAHGSVPGVEVVRSDALPFPGAPCGVLLFQHRVFPGNPYRFLVTPRRVRQQRPDHGHSCGTPVMFRVGRDEIGDRFHIVVRKHNDIAARLGDAPVPSPCRPRVRLLYEVERERRAAGELADHRRGTVRGTVRNDNDLEVDPRRDLTCQSTERDSE
jgi:hypothetical protein